MLELFVPYGYVIGRRPRKRLHLHLMDETITNLNPLTPLPILRLFQPAGTLDALAKCKNLKELNCYECRGLRGPCPRPAASKSPT